LKDEKEPSYLFLLLSHHEPKNLHRTIHVRLLGKDFYFCSRCTGKYSGVLLVFVLFLAGFRIPAWLNLCIIALFPLPATIDWLTQTIRMRESKTWIRIITGFLLGNAWAILLLSLISGMLLIFFYGIVILAVYASSIGIVVWKSKILENIE
jgi:uncharacterized membrane protein